MSVDGRQSVYIYVCVCVCLYVYMSTHLPNKYLGIVPGIITAVTSDLSIAIKEEGCDDQWGHCSHCEEWEEQSYSAFTLAEFGICYSNHFTLRYLSFTRTKTILSVLPFFLPSFQENRLASLLLCFEIRLRIWLLGRCSGVCPGGPPLTGRWCAWHINDNDRPFTYIWSFSSKRFPTVPHYDAADREILRGIEWYISTYLPRSG